MHMSGVRVSVCAYMYVCASSRNRVAMLGFLLVTLVVATTLSSAAHRAAHATSQV